MSTMGKKVEPIKWKIEEVELIDDLVLLDHAETLSLEINDKILLSDEARQSLEEELAVRNAEHYHTMKVLAVGPNANPKIKVGCYVQVVSNRFSNMERIVIGGKLYPIVPGTASWIAAVRKTK